MKKRVPGKTDLLYKSHEKNKHRSQKITGAVECVWVCVCECECECECVRACVWVCVSVCVCGGSWTLWCYYS